MKTLKDLLVAMVNATLILIALCLFLLWQLSGSAQDIAAEFAETITVVEPIGQDLRGLRTDVDALRQDIATLSASKNAGTGATGQALDIRLAALTTRMDSMEKAMTKLADTPDRLMAGAVDRAASRFANTAYALRGCRAPSDPVQADAPIQ